MADNVNRDAESPLIRMTALELVKPLDGKDRIGEICCCTYFVRQRIRYVGDIFGAETIQTPETTLQLGQGDCDDKAALLACLLVSIGHPVCFAVLEHKGEFVHVWTQVQIGRAWLDLETTENVSAGQLPAFDPADITHFFPVL